MSFDEQGHLSVTPRQLQDGLGTPEVLINRMLLPGTPAAIPTHAGHCELLERIGEQLMVHPRNLLFKGSTKIGFSIAPRHEKVWVTFGPESDLDLAIVDANYFTRIDEQVRRWERAPANRQRMLADQRLLKMAKTRTYNKGRFDCYRWFDLPPVPAADELLSHLAQVAVKEHCGRDRELTAFVFRDWWGVYRRYEHDLLELRRGLSAGQDPLPAGGDVPRPRPVSE